MGLKMTGAIAGTLIFALGVAAIAQDANSPEAMSPEPMDAQVAFEAREQQMKDFGAPLRGLRNVNDPGEMVEIATIYVEGFADLETLFPEDSIVPGSKALPAIWENWEEFVVEIDKARVFADELLAAAETGDQATFLEASQGFGPVCRDCHDNFRASMR